MTQLVELSPLEAEMERLRLLDLRRTAYHEAGHAVVGIALGVSPLWVTMGKREHADALGETKFSRLFHILEPEKNTEQSVLRVLAIDVAGYLAETKLCNDLGELIDDAIARGARKDMRKIDIVFRNRNALLNSNLLDDRDAVMAEVIPATERLLVENWGRVSTIAAMLLRFEKLSQSQVEAAFAAGEVPA